MLVYKSMPRKWNIYYEQNEDHNRDTKVANRFFENVAKFRYLRRAVA